MRKLLEKYNIRPRKSLDQHFLVDKGAIQKEIETADIKGNETVLEIGPGSGTLTCELVKAAGKVIVIEIDSLLANLIRKEFGDSVLVIEGDALKVEYPAFDKCVSNIPYSISGKLTIKLGELGKPAVLMYQKEFAKRLVAKPGEREYSRISVMAQYYFVPEYICTVPKHCYYPAPKVDSAIVKLAVKKKRMKVRDEEMFRRIVRALFTHRNQKAKKAFYHSRYMFDLTKGASKEIADKMPFSEKKVYELGLDELIQISDYVCGVV